MTQDPLVWEPEADVSLNARAIDGVSDERVQRVAAEANVMKDVIRDQMGTGPYVERALRYVDLAVQTVYKAAIDEELGTDPATPASDPVQASSKMAARLLAISTEASSAKDAANNLQGQATGLSVRMQEFRDGTNRNFEEIAAKLAALTDVDGSLSDRVKALETAVAALGRQTLTIRRAVPALPLIALGGSYDLAVVWPTPMPAADYKVELTPSSALVGKATTKIKTGTQTAAGVTVTVTASILVSAGTPLDLTAYALA